MPQYAMHRFLHAVRDAWGSKLTGIIPMTTEVFANAWTAEMGPSAYRLLCTRHGDHAWHKTVRHLFSFCTVLSLVV